MIYLDLFMVIGCDWRMANFIVLPTKNLFWLVGSNMKFMFHFIYGMSSLPLTNSIIFQDG